MAPQELKFSILHDLYLMNMVSVFPRSKAAYLAISKNRLISRLKKKCYKGYQSQNMKLIELELHGTSVAEKILFKWAICSEYGFGILAV